MKKLINFPATKIHECFSKFISSSSMNFKPIKIKLIFNIFPISNIDNSDVDMVIQIYALQ